MRIFCIMGWLLSLFWAGVYLFTGQDDLDKRKIIIALILSHIFWQAAMLFPGR